jgi:hypothetical protein
MFIWIEELWTYAFTRFVGIWSVLYDVIFFSGSTHLPFVHSERKMVKKLSTRRMDGMLEFLDFPWIVEP